MSIKEVIKQAIKYLSYTLKASFLFFSVGILWKISTNVKNTR